MPYMGYQSKKVEQSKTYPLKKSGYSIVFAKNSPVEKIRQPKTSAPVNYDVGNAAKQIDPANIFVEKERQVKKGKGQWRMSNLLRKNSKNSAFDENWQENYLFGKNYHGAPLN